MLLFGQTSAGLYLPAEMIEPVAGVNLGRLTFDLASASIGALPVTIAAPLPAGTNLIGRVDARGGDKIFSLAARLEITASHNAPGATGTLTSSAVPANTIWVVTVAGGNNGNRAMTRAFIRTDPNSVPLLDSLTTAANLWAIWNGHAHLQAGQTLSLIYTGAVAGDAISLRFNGYSMGA